MAFCQNCGNQLGAGERFCTNCGTQVATPQASDQPPVQQTSAPTNPYATSAPQQPAQQQAPQYGAAQPSPMQQGAGAASVAGGAAATPQPQPPYQQGSAAGTGAPRKETFKEMFLTTKGRLNRKPYILRGILLGILSSVLSNVMEVMSESDSLVMNLLTLVLFAAIIALCVLSVMLVIRRWHDLGKSGWFTLLLFVPLANLFVGIYLWVKKGDEGPNQYGEDPLAQVG